MLGFIEFLNRFTYLKEESKQAFWLYIKTYGESLETIKKWGSDFKLIMPPDFVIAKYLNKEAVKK